MKVSVSCHYNNVLFYDKVYRISLDGDWLCIYDSDITGSEENDPVHIRIDWIENIKVEV